MYLPLDNNNASVQKYYRESRSCIVWTGADFKTLVSNGRVYKRENEFVDSHFVQKRNQIL